MHGHGTRRQTENRGSRRSGHGGHSDVEWAPNAPVYLPQGGATPLFHSMPPGARPLPLDSFYPGPAHHSELYPDERHPPGPVRHPSHGKERYPPRLSSPVHAKRGGDPPRPPPSKPKQGAGGGPTSVHSRPSSPTRPADSRTPHHVTDSPEHGELPADQDADGDEPRTDPAGAADEKVGDKAAVKKSSQVGKVEGASPPGSRSASPAPALKHSGSGQKSTSGTEQGPSPSKLRPGSDRHSAGWREGDTPRGRPESSGRGEPGAARAKRVDSHSRSPSPLTDYSRGRGERQDREGKWEKQAWSERSRSRSRSPHGKGRPYDMEDDRDKNYDRDGRWLKSSREGRRLDDSGYGWPGDDWEEEDCSRGYSGGRSYRKDGRGYTGYNGRGEGHEGQSRGYGSERGLNRDEVGHGREDRDYGRGQGRDGEDDRSKRHWREDRMHKGGYGRDWDGRGSRGNQEDSPYAHRRHHDQHGRPGFDEGPRRVGSVPHSDHGGSHRSDHLGSEGTPHSRERGRNGASGPHGLKSRDRQAVLSPEEASHTPSSRPETQTPRERRTPAASEVPSAKTHTPVSSPKPTPAAKQSTDQLEVPIPGDTALDEGGKIAQSANDRPLPAGSQGAKPSHTQAHTSSSPSGVGSDDGEVPPSPPDALTEVHPSAASPPAADPHAKPQTGDKPGHGTRMRDALDNNKGSSTTQLGSSALTGPVSNPMSGVGVCDPSSEQPRAAETGNPERKQATETAVNMLTDAAAPPAPPEPESDPPVPPPPPPPPPANPKVPRAPSSEHIAQEQPTGHPLHPVLPPPVQAPTTSNSASPPMAPPPPPPPPPPPQDAPPNTTDTTEAMLISPQAPPSTHTLPSHPPSSTRLTPPPAPSHSLHTQPLSSDAAKDMNGNGVDRIDPNSMQHQMELVPRMTTAQYREHLSRSGTGTAGQDSKDIFKVEPEKEDQIKDSVHQQLSKLALLFNKEGTYQSDVTSLLDAMFACTCHEFDEGYPFFDELEDSSAPGAFHEYNPVLAQPHQAPIQEVSLPPPSAPSRQATRVVPFDRPIDANIQDPRAYHGSKFLDSSRDKSPPAALEKVFVPMLYLQPALEQTSRRGDTYHRLRPSQQTVNPEQLDWQYLECHGGFSRKYRLDDLRQRASKGLHVWGVPVYCSRVGLWLPLTKLAMKSSELEWNFDPRDMPNPDNPASPHPAQCVASPSSTAPAPQKDVKTSATPPPVEDPAAIEAEEAQLDAWLQSTVSSLPSEAVFKQTSVCISAAAQQLLQVLTPALSQNGPALKVMNGHLMSADPKNAASSQSRGQETEPLKPLSIHSEAHNVHGADVSEKAVGTQLSLGSGRVGAQGPSNMSERANQVFAAARVEDMERSGGAEREGKDVHMADVEGPGGMTSEAGAHQNVEANREKAQGEKIVESDPVSGGDVGTVGRNRHNSGVAEPDARVQHLSTGVIDAHMADAQVEGQEELHGEQHRAAQEEVMQDVMADTAMQHGNRQHGTIAAVGDAAAFRDGRAVEQADGSLKAGEASKGVSVVRPAAVGLADANCEGVDAAKHADVAGQLVWQLKPVAELIVEEVDKRLGADGSPRAGAAPTPMPKLKGANGTDGQMAEDIEEWWTSWSSEKAMQEMDQLRERLRQMREQRLATARQEADEARRKAARIWGPPPPPQHAARLRGEVMKSLLAGGAKQLALQLLQDATNAIFRQHMNRGPSNALDEGRPGAEQDSAKRRKTVVVNKPAAGTKPEAALKQKAGQAVVDARGRKPVSADADRQQAQHAGDTAARAEMGPVAGKGQAGASAKGRKQATADADKVHGHVTDAPARMDGGPGEGNVHGRETERREKEKDKAKDVDGKGREGRGDRHGAGVRQPGKDRSGLGGKADGGEKLVSAAEDVKGRGERGRKAAMKPVSRARGPIQGLEDSDEEDDDFVRPTKQPRLEAPDKGTRVRKNVDEGQGDHKKKLVHLDVDQSGDIPKDGENTDTNKVETGTGMGGAGRGVGEEVKSEGKRHQEGGAAEGASDHGHDKGWLSPRQKFKHFGSAGGDGKARGIGDTGEGGKHAGLGTSTMPKGKGVDKRGVEEREEEEEGKVVSPRQVDSVKKHTGASGKLAHVDEGLEGPSKQVHHRSSGRTEDEKRGEAKDGKPSVRRKVTGSKRVRGTQEDIEQMSGDDKEEEHVHSKTVEAPKKVSKKKTGDGARKPSQSHESPAHRQTSKMQEAEWSSDDEEPSKSAAAPPLVMSRSGRVLKPTKVTSQMDNSEEEEDGKDDDKQDDEPEVELPPAKKKKGPVPTKQAKGKKEGSKKKEEQRKHEQVGGEKPGAKAAKKGEKLDEVEQEMLRSGMTMEQIREQRETQQQLEKRMEPTIRKAMNQALKNLKKLDEEKFQGTFAEPVPLDWAPDYDKVIKQPMDLRTMEEQLKEGLYPFTYQGMAEFEHHFKLIGQNCMVYNPPGNMYHDYGKNFLQLGEKEIAKMRRTVDSHQQTSLAPRRQTRNAS